MFQLSIALVAFFGAKQTSNYTLEVQLHWEIYMAVSIIQRLSFYISIIDKTGLKINLMFALQDFRKHTLKYIDTISAITDLFKNSCLRHCNLSYAGLLIAIDIQFIYLSELFGASISMYFTTKVFYNTIQINQ